MRFIAGPIRSHRIPLATEIRYGFSMVMAVVDIRISFRLDLRPLLRRHLTIVIDHLNTSVAPIARRDTHSADPTRIARTLKGDRRPRSLLGLSSPGYLSQYLPNLYFSNVHLRSGTHEKGHVLRHPRNIYDTVSLICPISSSVQNPRDLVSAQLAAEEEVYYTDTVPQLEHIHNLRARTRLTVLTAEHQ